MRQKYLQGKFRYDPIDEDDYNLRSKSVSHRSRSRSSTVNSRPSSRPSVSNRSIPRLSHRDISEYDRLKYRKLEKRLEEQGFRNTDDNYESLYLAKGDINLAVEILSNSDSGETKPALPRRPGTSVSGSSNGLGAARSQSISQPVTASNDWWTGQPSSASSQQQTASPAVFDGTGSALGSQQPTGLIQPPQQYLDPATGVIYVDPIQQEQYLQQQQQLQLQQQQTGFFQQVSQQQTGVFQQQQQPQQTGAFYQQQQPYQTGGVIPQRTGVDKNQLLSLYNTGAQQPQQQAQQGYQFGNGYSGYSYQ